MSVIDKECVHPAYAGLKEDRLAVVGMTGADVYQPGKPEVHVVTDPLEAGSGQDFQQANTIPAEEARTEAEAWIWPKTPLRGLNPTVWVPVDEGAGDQQWLPRRNLKPAGAVKLASDALVEGQVGALEIVGELDYIDQPVTCLIENGLRTATQLSNMLHYKSEVLTRC